MCRKDDKAINVHADASVNNVCKSVVLAGTAGQNGIRISNVAANIDWDPHPHRQLFTCNAGGHTLPTNALLASIIRTALCTRAAEIQIRGNVHTCATAGCLACNGNGKHFWCTPMHFTKFDNG